MDTHAERASMQYHTPGVTDRSPRGRAFLRITIAFYLLVLGMLCGTLAERIRFDLRREPVLTRYDALLRARNIRLMEIERAIADRSGPAGVDPAAPVPFGMPAAAADH